MSQRRLLASLQAPFLKEKKGVRFTALHLQQKRNLLVLDHSHQQVSYFFHAHSVVKWINVDQLKLQMNPIFRISVDIFVRAFTTSANVPSTIVIGYSKLYNMMQRLGFLAFKSISTGLL
ncbi:hypothetical protein Tco_0127324 [Tanacetum coccineum]